ncbi:class B sortase [Ohessyouella blattaphilus]|uniref:Class B sortase n=1 Tax=Ohessyouella blattaphilus TaxID=2949333 RepID=A0ABT1EJD8_9FIRM|nr:class B sortase [Ohessyouella blattaphilus]MCP1110812.1 class B sortase [Ohessyouella blattaphilus]MCR8564206.1 class B sortase [Ohessyouella blattaphilus]
MSSRREQRKKKKGSGIISTIILIIAIIVLIVSGVKLFFIIKGYLDGRSEYKEIAEKVIINTEDNEEEFYVDFEALKALNPDTCAWIRFPNEPKIINYPVVHTDNNDTYLHKTFSANENTVGAIFLNAYNNPDFSDRHSIVYGHYMNDGSMFNKLEDYKDQEFQKANPIFYLYTPDGMRHTYEVFSVAKILENDDSYIFQFNDDAEFEKVLARNKEVSLYDTGTQVDKDSKIMTLSTCTSLNYSDERWKITAVRTESVEMVKPEGK